MAYNQGIPVPDENIRDLCSSTYYNSQCSACYKYKTRIKTEQNRCTKGLIYTDRDGIYLEYENRRVNGVEDMKDASGYDIPRRRMDHGVIVEKEVKELSDVFGCWFIFFVKRMKLSVNTEIEEE